MQPKLNPVPCKILVALLLWSGVAAAGASAQNARGAQTPPGKKFVYKTSHGKPQDLEIYFPANHDPAKSKIPAVLMFHGGGWSGGSLMQFRHACAYLASRGLVAATANYHMHDAEARAMLPENVSRKRVCVTDAISAIRWIKQHAGKLGIDPQRLVVGGSSAGGHVAMLATLGSGLDDPADPKEIDTRVVGYLLFNPAFVPRGSDNDDTVDVFAQLKPGIAPSILFFGDKDPWKPAADSLVPKLREQGASVTMWVAEGEGHTFWIRPGWRDLTLIEADRFLASLDLLPGASPLTPPADGKRLKKAK